MQKPCHDSFAIHARKRYSPGASLLLPQSEQPHHQQQQHEQQLQDGQQVLQTAGVSSISGSAAASRGKGSNAGRNVSGYTRNCMAISRMDRELAQQLALAQLLEAEQTRLQAEHQLLLECCDGMALLRLRSSQHDDAGGYAAGELALLQQLQSIQHPSLPLQEPACPGSNSSGSGSHASSCSPVVADSQAAAAAAAAASAATANAAAGIGAGAAGVDTPADRRLAPDDDVMFYLRYMLSLPLFPGSQTLTVRELVLDYANTVQQVAVQLHLLQRPPSMHCPQQQHPADRIKALLDRHLHLIVTLVLLQRSEVMEGFMLTNFETLETSEEHQLAKHEWVLQHTGISQQQMLTIGRASEFFDRLLQPIMQERQQLQREIAELSEHANVVSSESGCISSSIDSYKQNMAKREALLARLSSLLGKEYLVRLASACAVCGPLTYTQLATLVVQMTPHPVSLQVLGKLLQQQMKQQQQQQQPMQQQQQVATASRQRS